MMKFTDYWYNKSKCRALLRNYYEGNWVSMQDGYLYGPEDDYEYVFETDGRWKNKCTKINKLLMADDGRPEKDKLPGCGK